jgi:rare lipoprotein A
MIAMLQKEKTGLLLNRITGSTRVSFGKLRINCNRRSIGAMQPVTPKKIIRTGVILFLAGLFIVNPAYSQEKEKEKQEKEKKKLEKEKDKDNDKKKTSNRILYGTASFYSNKFQGRKTANGEIFDQNKMTAACNVLPLGTWIRVTNLRNKKSVIVKTNDRLHTKMKRIVDLSKVAATQLGYIKSGLTRVKVEVLGKKKPAQ